MAVLQLRAQVLQEIRQFFLKKAVLEVETPLMSHAVGTDPQLAFFTTQYRAVPVQQRLFLQTSPEFAMKRLLAAGSGSIYQICKAFRNGESGRFHNPEFTLLEWYRVGFSLPMLMDDVDELIVQLFVQRGQPLAQTQRFSYQVIFKQYTGLDALSFDYGDYCRYALESQCAEAVTLCGKDHVLWLDFLFSHYIQPHLGKNRLCMVYDYPACQSSLARIKPGNPQLVERVELFINGIELGNGYCELTDAKEQDKRFNDEITLRQQKNLPQSIKDQHLIDALTAGLPECSGIAIGLDRLLMVLSESRAIEDVLSFPTHRA
ncbi:Elongation factor P--(R)-beta-lysine ligase [Crenothrix polyspora]|uniref:Elongation factor P--(R)-beta-lysine ligase n=1 Tax=Crenothrix polyspora TaxID=360316 RepID=A0A1R4HG71_9GAMM|nr:Elongation factor P--(R)-beta-lysine ligase [Crenothrix polyspora]